MILHPKLSDTYDITVSFCFDSVFFSGKEKKTKNYRLTLMKMIITRRILKHFPQNIRFLNRSKNYVK